MASKQAREALDRLIEVETELINMLRDKEDGNTILIGLLNSADRLIRNMATLAMQRGVLDEKGREWFIKHAMDVLKIVNAVEIVER